MAIGRYEEARTAIKIAYDRRPMEIRVINAQAEAMYRTGEFDGLDAFLRQHAREAGTVDSWLLFSKYADKMNDPDSAQLGINTAIELDGGATIAPYMLAARFAERLGDRTRPFVACVRRFPSRRATRNFSKNSVDSGRFRARRLRYPPGQ